jgi:hypothetical protein
MTNDRAIDFLKRKTQEIEEEIPRKRFEDAFNRTPVAEQQRVRNTTARTDADKAAATLANLVNKEK